MSMRVIHVPHPNGSPHPLKFTSLCGKLIRFGGIEIEGERPATCKACLKISATICPTCKGTGIRQDIACRVTPSGGF